MYIFHVHPSSSLVHRRHCKAHFASLLGLVSSLPFRSAPSSIHNIDLLLSLFLLAFPCFSLSVLFRLFLSLSPSLSPFPPSFSVLLRLSPPLHLSMFSFSFPPLSLSFSFASPSLFLCILFRLSLAASLFSLPLFPAHMCVISRVLPCVRHLGSLRSSLHFSLFWGHSCFFGCVCVLLSRRIIYLFLGIAELALCAHESLTHAPRVCVCVY